MQMNDPISELKRLLSPEDLPVVVSALRFDPLVWKLVNDPDSFRRAAEAAGSQPDSWSPAALALTTLEQDIPVDTLRSLPLQPLNSDLRQQAVQAYEDMLRNPQPPTDLKQAGLLALALRERRRLTESWQGLLAELQGTSAAGAALPLDYWNAPLACLYGMAPDPVYLFNALISTGDKTDHSADANLIVHALLSNPVRSWEQVRILTALLSAEPPDVLMAFLAALKDQAAPEVVDQLSSILTRSKGIADLTSRASAKSAKGLVASDPLAKIEPIQQIADRQALARFFLESNRSEDALSLLNAAKETLRNYQAEVALLEAKAAIHQHRLETAVQSIKLALELVPSSTKARLDLAEAYLQLGHYDEASAVLPAEAGDPRAFLARSLIASAAEKIPQARDYAQTAAKNAASLPKDARYQLLDQLVNLGLFAEAEQVAGAATQEFPADYRFYNLLTRAHTGAKNIPDAVQTAQLVTSLSPSDPSAHRLAADAFEAAQDWLSCLEERRNVITLSNTPCTADYHSLAASALQAGDPAETIQVCKQVLKVNPEDGLAHTYLGEAALVNSDLQMALDEFSQATLLLPDDAQAWLGLSKTYQTAGEQQKSIDTLRSAAQAAPHNPEILLALGQACLAVGAPTEALPALRRAAAIAPHSPELSLQLGNTLYELGRLTEAKQVLERSRSYWPNHPGLALAAGKTQLGLGEIASALQALEIVLRDNPQDPEPYMLYAQSILDLARSSDQIGAPAGKNQPVVDISLAHGALSKALELDPDNFEARVLMGEAQAAGGKLQAALDTYLQLSEMDEAKDPRWNARIHLGMGRVALALDQMDTAIAALQEAVQADPENLEINQALAEAYQAAKLSEEATVQARTALGMAPDKVENLLWFAGISLKMKDELEAIQTLQHALDVAPQRADLRLSLAHLQVQLKDEPSARKTLKNILDVEQVSPAEMSQAADLFYELGDLQSATACLQKAIYANPQPSAELWAKLASLHVENGAPDAALEAVQTALEIRPFDAGLHFLHGNLLAGQNKKQAALSCFEQSLDLIEKNPGSSWVFQAEDLLPEPLKLRIAGLLRGLGDLRAALVRAQDVVSSNPKSMPARYLASDLAASLLENHLALDLAALPGSGETVPAEIDQPDNIAADRSSLVKLLCLQAEMYIENEDDLNAADALAHAAELAPEDPRVLADQARLDARRGDFLDGMDHLEAALSHLHAEQTAEAPTLPIAEAALELHQWQTALPLYAQVIRTTPDEARPHFSLARAYARAAEYQPAYHNLNALRHASAQSQNPEEDFLAFEREIQAAESLATSPEINRWYQRGISAMHHGHAQVEAKDAFAAFATLEETQPSDPAVEGESTPKSMPEQLDRLFQHGLVQKDAEPEMAMATAQALVSQKPGHPLYEALFAAVARKNHDPALAYSAIQSALNTWQDEPLWHVFAAETAEECSAPSEALEHWKQACALEPENASFTCALGEAYLKAGNAEKAVQTLEQATSMEPSDSSAWVSLAHAYRVRRNYPEAIGAAEKAIRLAPGEILPLATSGDIALEAKQFELGRQRAQEILALDANNPKAVLLLAKAEAHQGRPVQALQVIDEALPTMLEPYEVLLERGRLIHQLHGASPALEAFRNLAQRYPDEPEALSEYALTLAETGQKDAAERTAQSALQIKPEQADLHLLLGRIQHSAGQLDQAIFHLSEAVHLAPENVEAYLELGKTYADRREQTQALQVYQQAFAIAPDDYRPYFQAGLSLKDCKDYVMSETMLRRAAELAPDDLNIRRQLAAIIAINLVHNPQEAPTIK